MMLRFRYRTAGGIVAGTAESPDDLDAYELVIPVGKEVIAITDNLSTRTTKEVADWLAEHPRWRFVFTP